MGAVETSSVELAKRLTLKGLGISFQTRIGIENEISSGQLVHIPIARPSTMPADLGVYVRTARNPPIAVHTMVDLFSKEVTKLAAQQSG
ncbi:LysR substrate-binding domain-containing protein [Sphingobium sp.]|uniref:LysR substrate-binding domain-containing protein n=1 Tax=Sphingobium sp. TaxID=1912891 RepID=UPI002D7E7016|nr:LysR substrate-binding domain-containing protein [Sphingobium sp.]